MVSPALNSILAKARAGDQLYVDEALLLVHAAPLAELCAAARRARQQRVSAGHITYALHTIQVPLRPQPERRAHSLASYTALLAWLRSQGTPVAHVSLSTNEIRHLAQQEGLPVPDVLAALAAAGLRRVSGSVTIEVHREPAHRRGAAQRHQPPGNLQVARLALQSGMQTTVMVPVVAAHKPDQAAAWVQALQRIRSVHDYCERQYGAGFAACAVHLPPDGTAWPAGKAAYARSVAVARLFLATINAHQVSGAPTPAMIQMALESGVGAIAYTASVSAQPALAAYETQTIMGHQQLRALIHQAGYTPVSRSAELPVHVAEDCAMPGTRTPQRALPATPLEPTAYTWVN